MQKTDWRKVIIGSMAGVILTGCASSQRPLTGSASADPATRAFQGTIVSLRYPTSTMLISKDERLGRDQFPNIIAVKYDAQTQFTLDNKPATLDQLQQYMPVSIQGAMRDGQLVATNARFSSVLPQNVRPARSLPAPSAQNP